MKVIATIMQANTNKGPTAIAISPNDNVWFVPLEAAPDIMLKEAEALMPPDRGTVLGFVTVSEDFKL